MKAYWLEKKKTVISLLLDVSKGSDPLVLGSWSQRVVAAALEHGRG